MAGAPSQVGDVTPSALEVGVSKKHPTTSPISSLVIPKILSKNFPFLGQIHNPALIPCREQEGRI